MMRQSIGLAAGVFSAMAIATPVPASDIVSKNDIPAAVAKLMDCGTEPESIVRQPFADGFVFRWPCASNHANQIEMMVYAKTENGDDPRVLRFPSPGKPSASNPSPELSNIRFSGDREISSLFVDPESRICRSEGVWRLDAAAQQPRLIRWRQTRDCDGKRGWHVIVDRTSRAKTK